VKQQHLERNVEFLVDELKVVQGHEAPNRVFFVSAREALVSRVNQDKGTPTPTGQLLEGFQGRIFEFANFERKFEVFICNSLCDSLLALCFTITVESPFIATQLNSTGCPFELSCVAINGALYACRLYCLGILVYSGNFS